MNSFGTVNSGQSSISSFPNIKTQITDEDRIRFSGESLIYRQNNKIFIDSVLTYLSMCGYKFQTNVNIINIATDLDFAWSYFHFEKVSEYQKIPNFYGMYISVNKNTWRILESIRKMFKIKEYNTITEMCAAGRMGDNMYLIRFEKDQTLK